MNAILSTPVVLAVIGGVVIDVLNLIELQHVPKEQRPDFRSVLYWLPYLAWPFLGGLLGFLYTSPAAPLGKVVAFQVGLSAPLILRTMANTIPVKPPQTPPGA